MYPWSRTRMGNMRRIWLDSESSAIDEVRLAGDGVYQAPRPDKAHLYGVATNATIYYDSNGVIKLVIIDPGGDGNWQDDEFTIDLGVDKAGVSPAPAATVTVVDTDSAPTVEVQPDKRRADGETQTTTTR